MSGEPDNYLIRPIRGKTFSFAVFPEEANGDVMNLSGYTGRGQIRDKDSTSDLADASTVLLATFSVTITAPPLTGDDLDDATEAGATASHYKVTCALTAAATDHTVTAISTANNEGVYDIEAVSGATVKLVARGTAKFYADRTHI